MAGFRSAVLMAALSILGSAALSAQNSVPAIQLTSVQAITGSCTLSLANGRDQSILVDATARDVSCTLPTAVGNAGVRFTFKKTDSSAHRVTIEGASGQTIDGAGNTLLAQSLQHTTVVSNGKNWAIVDDANTMRSVFAYGAKCDDATDDSSAFAASIAAQGLAYVPLGRCLINLTITDNNVRILGQSSAAASPLNSSVRAFNPARPVIQIGNDSSLVTGVHIDNLAFEASASTGTGSVGLYCAGGCYKDYFSELSFNHFSQYGLRVQGGTKVPASLAFFSGITCQAAPSQSACVFVSSPSSGSQYTSEIYFAQSSFTMGGNTSGQLLLVDSADQVHLSQVHLQAMNGHSLQIAKSYSQIPKVAADDLTIDSSSSSDVLVQVYGTTKTLTDYLIGIVAIDGLLQFGDGQTVALNNSTAPTRLIERLNGGVQYQIGTASAVGWGPVVWQSNSETHATSGTAESLLASGRISGNALDKDKTQLVCEAWGNYAANGNTKTLRAYAGDTLIHTNVTTSNGGGWNARWWIVRTGSHAQTGSGFVVSAAPSAGPTVTSTLDDSTSITLKLTGQGSATNDIVSNHITCTWLPEPGSGGGF
jgi:hypothetical protein